MRLIGMLGVLFVMLLCATVVRAADAPTTKPTSAPSVPRVGDIAADFTLKTLDDQPRSLHEITAKSPVILIVLRGWPGYQCPFCTKQVAGFLGKQQAIKDAGARVLMVYPGKADHLKNHAKDFVAGKDLPAHFDLVIDPDFTFTNLYKLRWDAKGETAYPSTFVIDSENVIRYAKVSTSHGDRAPVDAVLKALNEKK